MVSDPMSDPLERGNVGVVDGDLFGSGCTLQIRVPTQESSVKAEVSGATGSFKNGFLKSGLSLDGSVLGSNDLNVGGHHSNGMFQSLPSL